MCNKKWILLNCLFLSREQPLYYEGNTYNDTDFMQLYNSTDQIFIFKLYKTKTNMITIFVYIYIFCYENVPSFHILNLLYFYITQSVWSLIKYTLILKLSITVSSFSEVYLTTEKKQKNFRFSMENNK